MIIPYAFFGKYIEVRARTARIAGQLLSGKTVDASLPDNRSINTITTDTGSFLFLTLPDISVTRLDFHMTLLRAALVKAGGMPDGSVADGIFTELLQKEWGVLMFADRKDEWFSTSFIADCSHRWKPYLAAVLKFASVYTAEKKRFFDERGNAGTFWQANSSLNYILAQMGIPEEQLKARLDEVSFRSMCRKLGIV